MTNQELIDQLSKLPPHLPVFIEPADGIDGTITGVRLDKNGCTDTRTWQNCDCITIEHD